MPSERTQVRYPPRLELVGGPMDGDKRSTFESDIFFTSSVENHVNWYQKIGNEFNWNGIVPWRTGIKHIFRLNPGQNRE